MALRLSPIHVKLNKSDIYVFESHHAPGFEMKLGIWDFDKLCIIRKGRGCVSSTATEIARIREDDVLYIPAGIPHRFEDEASNPISLVMICFNRDAMLGHMSVALALKNFCRIFHALSPFALTRTHRRAAILINLKRMVFEQTTARSGSDAVIWGLLAQLLVMLSRSANEVGTRVSLTNKEEAFAKTLDFLDEHYTDPVQITDLADMAGLSYRRYTTLFKQAKGETVNSYITGLRLNYAKKRLAESGNVLFSALESGFGDLSHFYRVFKKETGLTPKQFLKKTR